MFDANRPHLESYGVDLGIFASCLLISRWRYRTWSLKESIAALRMDMPKREQQKKSSGDPTTNGDGHQKGKAQP